MHLVRVAQQSTKVKKLAVPTDPGRAEAVIFSTCAVIFSTYIIVTKNPDCLFPIKK